MPIKIAMPPGATISPENKLIVLHTPKCGGSSLLGSLTDAFGPAAIYRDYKFIKGERMAPRTNIDEPVIYGHFRAKKYEPAQGVWVTLLREPVDRMLSLYFNWRFSSPKPLKNRIGALRRQVRQNRISFLDFARRPNMANRIHGHYFRDFDMNRFSLIIPHDNYAAGVQRMGEMIGVPLSVMARNVSSSRSAEYEKARREFLSNEAEVAELKSILANEIAFYEKCMALPNAWRRKE